MARGPKARYLPAILEVLKEQHGVLTVRQIFYRLVSKGIIQNKISNYIQVSRVLKQGRINGSIPWNRIEDRSKPIYEGEDYHSETPEGFFETKRQEYEEAEDTFRDSFYEYSLPLWYGQPKHVEVWIEKDALSGVFSQVTNKYHVPLAVCRGYQSISNIYDSIRRMAYIKRNYGKEPLILYFGDYDPRGENIPEIIEQDFEALGFPIAIHKIALTREQIIEYKLIPQPTKRSDKMASAWIETEGDNVWELDALEPNTLISIIDSAIREHFNEEIFQKRKETIEQAKKEIQNRILAYFNEEEETEDGSM